MCLCFVVCISWLVCLCFVLYLCMDRFSRFDLRKGLHSYSEMCINVLMPEFGRPEVIQSFNPIIN